ncbi:hypothetical protein J1N35_038091 [Gossypium stocksii]|uniref:Uncharacterized protein n=1 Tax=Gossypium stocksii TaxID=47602 RepID=A0A9D3UL83_9ROSI|nr:hypothetical protein J1N35_038091 [Gossypium stocksii]
MDTYVPVFDTCNINASESKHRKKQLKIYSTFGWMESLFHSWPIPRATVIFLYYTVWFTVCFIRQFCNYVHIPSDAVIDFFQHFSPNQQRVRPSSSSPGKTDFELVTFPALVPVMSIATGLLLLLVKHANLIINKVTSSLLLQRMLPRVKSSIFLFLYFFKIQSEKRLV